MDTKLVTLLKYHWLGTIGKASFLKLLGMCDEDGTRVQTQEQWVSTFSQQGDNSPCQNVCSDSLTKTHLEHNWDQCRLLLGAHS